jgi:hypothetical protein
MGLDMYLTKKHYIGNQYKKPEEQIKLGLPDIKDERLSEITERVMYWRKANAIHKWFVENVQDGEDDCGEYYVERESLKKLMDILDTIIKGSKTKKAKIQVGTRSINGKTSPIMEDGELITNPELAQKLLPCESGFFFGGTEFDNYYLEECKRTLSELTALLKENDKGDFYYHSSW